jgi:hypothetical protein
MLEEILDEKSLPAVPKSKYGRYRTRKKEVQGMLLEAAASAYVLMENGEYKFPEGYKRQFDADHNPVPHKSELMRLAGYAKGSWDHFDQYLGSQDKFWELVELYRVRRNDPLFRKDRQADLWAEVGNESLRHLYEVVKYYPHSLSITDHIKVIDLILKAGVQMQKVGGSTENKTAELLELAGKDKRDKLLTDYEKSIQKELDEVQRLKSAHKAADEEL